MLPIFEGDGTNITQLFSNFPVFGHNTAVLFAIFPQLFKGESVWVNMKDYKINNKKLMEEVNLTKQQGTLSLFWQYMECLFSLGATASKANWRVW